MTTVQEIFDEKLPAKLTDNPKTAALQDVFQFKIIGDDGGEWYVDFARDGDYVQPGEADAPGVTIEMKDTDFVDMWEGNLPGAQAFMMGKVKIQGNMNLAMRLQNFIG